MVVEVSDIVLTNRETVFVSNDILGIIVTEAEAMKMLRDGHNIKVRVTPSLQENEEKQYYLMAHISARSTSMLGDILDVSKLGRVDVVIFPYYWQTWKLSGIKSYLKSIKKAAEPEKDDEIILVRAIQTCPAAPSQWDGWDVKGRYWYLRFRHGRGTIGRTYDVNEAVSSFRDNGAPDIALEDMCYFLGVTWAPEAERAGTIWEDPPQV